MTTTVSTDTIGSVERLGVRRVLEWSAARVREHPVLVLAFLLAGLAGYVPLVGGLLSYLATLFAVGAATLVAADALAARERSTDELAAAVRSRYVTLLVVSVAYTLAVFVGLLLLVLPGLYVLVRLAPAIPAAVTGTGGAGDALREGWATGRRNLLRIAGVFLAILLVQIALGLLVALVGGQDLAATGLSAVLVNALVGPVLAIAIAHVYFDSRELADAGEPADADRTTPAAA